MTEVTRYAFQITPTDRVSEPIIRELLNDDGKHGDKIARDGIFSGEVTIEDPGEYRLRVIARGPTFERVQELPFRVKPRLVTLEVVNVESDLAVEAAHGHTEAGASEEYFRVELSPEAVALRKVHVELLAIDEHRKRYKLPLTQSKDRSIRFEVPVKNLPHDGEYELTAILTGEDKRRRKVRGVSKTLHYNRITKEIDEEEPVEVVVVKEKEPEKPTPWWPFALLVTLANAGLGAFCFMKLKREDLPETEEVEEYVPPQELLDAIAELEAKCQTDEIDIDDPIFSDDSLADLPVRKGAPRTAAPEESAAATEDHAEEGEQQEEAQEPTGEESQQADSDETSDEQAEEPDGTAESEKTGTEEPQAEEDEEQEKEQ
ncbi:MAG: hypothetical protein D6719_01260 [Candidatus Dadabacteria bacterium]|nr:MAG: hypothetical protein D6719_01260 [Candidatus Dadabacteria bacterium]